MTTTAHTEQAAPSAGRQDVFPELVRMLQERYQLGVDRYGTPLQTFNGRDAGRDLFDELIDAFQYGKQLDMENTDLRTTLLAFRVALQGIVDEAAEHERRIEAAKASGGKLTEVYGALRAFGEMATLASTVLNADQTCIADLRHFLATRAMHQGRIATLEADNRRFFTALQMINSCHHLSDARRIAEGALEQRGAAGHLTLHLVCAGCGTLVTRRDGRVYDTGKGVPHDCDRGPEDA